MYCEYMTKHRQITDRHDETPTRRTIDATKGRQKHRNIFISVFTEGVPHKYKGEIMLHFLQL